MEIDQAVGIRRLVDVPRVEREIERVVADVPGEFWPDFIVLTGEIAKALGAVASELFAAPPQVEKVEILGTTPLKNLARAGR